MRRSALKLGIALILLTFGLANAYPKRGGGEDERREKRSVDLNEQHRLDSDIISDDLRPIHYDLEIEPLIQDSKFKARAAIMINWTESADKITLHSHPDLEIVDVQVTRLNDVPKDDDSSEEMDKAPASIKVKEIEKSPRGKLLIHLDKMQRRGATCRVNISYVGNITANITSGIFSNSFNDASGLKHTYVATYLRLNNARKVFPGYDQLQYKTKFRLTLVRPKNMTALSNTPLEKSEPVPDKPDLVKDVFQETPEMTTYQLGFLISDMEFITPTKKVNAFDGKELQVRVYGRKEYMEALKDVPDKIVTIVNYLQEYFNSSIKLPKLDVVALPGYTATKASDNWGLMIFKEAEISSPLVWNTAYELIYQWIGQYITPFRWMDASENKGLNSFLASKTTMDINPDELKGKWPMNILYSLYYGYGKTLGANRGSGIIRDAKFAKIELVFRMFYYVLGKDNFRNSMRHLIQTQSLPRVDPVKDRDPRSFTQTDIYNSMNVIANSTKSLPAGLTINEVADTWIDQERLPLITVTRHYDNKTITFSQKPYVRETVRKSPSTWESSYQWNIPLIMQSKNKWNNNDYVPKSWLLKSKSKQDLNIPDIDDKDSFVVVNPEEIGLFPVNYDQKNWQLLAEYLQGSSFETIPTLTRAKLLHDSWNLAYADELSFKIALNMTLFLKHEKSHVVWEPFFTMIDHVGRRIEGSDAYNKFNDHALRLLVPMYTEPCELAQSNEPSWKTHLRGLARYFLCRAGYEPCITEARAQFKKWMNDKEPDQGNPVANEFICPVFKWGTDEEWNFGLQRVIKFPKDSPERKQSERTYLLKTLAGCPKDADKIKRLLNVAIIDRNENFTDPDIHLIFSMLTSNENGYTTLFKFLTENWATVKKNFDGKKNLWTSAVQSATGFFKNQDGLDKVQKMYKEHEKELDGAENFVKEALENIKQETRWSEKNLPLIEQWLDENKSNVITDASVIQYWKDALVCPKRSDNVPATPPAS